MGLNRFVFYFFLVLQSYILMADHRRPNIFAPLPLIEEIVWEGPSRGDPREQQAECSQ